MQSKLKRHGLLALASVIALASAGCAEERDPINRVQPNALKKAFFVGAALNDGADDPEFYYRPSIIDVDYGAGHSSLFTASYAQTASRIKWEITEDLLIARVTFDRIADASGDGSVTDNTGQPAAAFRISSHFDIKRDYNPQTGEEVNVINENGSDRPWYQREFFRVDWSQNLITGAYQLDTLAAAGLYADAPIRYEPLAYYVENPNDPDRPVFDSPGGYFDVTNKVYAVPQTISTPFGTYPACFFGPDVYNGGGPAISCNSSEVKVRLAFKRVEDRDFEPQDWDGQRQDMFGLFTLGTLSPERYGYDRRYGIVDNKWYRFASRHNIWAQSHSRSAAGEAVRCYTAETTPPGADPNRDENADGTDDECAAVGSGSRCDRWSNACTIPYRSRETRQIPWYISPGYDPGLFESTENALMEWDEALRHSVQAARYTECVAAGKYSDQARTDCRAQFPATVEASLQAVPQIFALCRNPVTTEDHPMCGEPGLAPRLGDLRYNSVNIIEAPQSPSSWGILADAIDPLTGEVIQGSVNSWNYVTDVAAQSTVDLMRWFLGELSTDDITSGDYLSQYVEYVKRDGAGRRDPAPMDVSEVDRRLSGLDSRLMDPSLPEPTITDFKRFPEQAATQFRQRFGDAALGTGNAPILARLATARGSAVEAELTTEPWMNMGGLDKSTPLEGSSFDLASPLRGNSFRLKMDIDRQRQLRLASSGRCMLDMPEPGSVGDWARILDRKFPLEGTDAKAVAERNEKWFQYLRRILNESVLVHELGHSMGLRHVFTSSYDAMNFRPQYWQLRTRDGQVTQNCASPSADGQNCVGPRWYDPVTPEESDGLVWMWHQTSVMDYPGDYTMDNMGIGAYDRAAVRFAYTGVVDVIDDPAFDCTVGGGGQGCSTQAAILEERLDSFGGIGGPWYGSGINQPFHYSQLHNRLNLLRNCRPADMNPPADWDVAVKGVWDPLLDGKIVNGTVCEGLPVDHARYADLSGQSADGGGVGSVGGAGVIRKVDPVGRIRKPYLFASDEYADTGNVAAYRHDNGADAYEITHFLISQYEDRHIFDNYRRNRTTFSVKGAFSRGQARYNEKIKNMAQGFALYNEILTALNARDQYVAGAFGDGLLKANALASGIAFDHFARILTRPSDGPHMLERDPFNQFVARSTDQLAAGTTVVSLSVPNGSTQIGGYATYGGRPLHNALDQSKGYYSTSYDYTAGSYYDKTVAVEFLTESVDRFVSQSRDDFFDGRYRNLSFANVFPEGVRRLIAAAVTEDWDMLGWRVSANAAGGLEVNSGLPTRGLGYRAWWLQDGPGTCWSDRGQQTCYEWPTENAVGSTAPAQSVALDPEIGWEVQKFVIFWTLLYLPENQKMDWVDMMRVYKVGVDPMPDLDPNTSVSWRDPVSDQLYVAHSYGKEVIDGKTVDRGIAARALEWANTLTARGYEVESTNPITGEITVRRHVNDTNCAVGVTYCNGQPVVADQGYATRMSNYRSVLDFMRSVAAGFGFYDPAWRGIYQ